MGGDSIGFAEALLGLVGFRVLGVGDLDGEVVVLIETTANWHHYRGRGARRQPPPR